jgi:cytochrome b involved in lipid metabolism
LVLDVSGWEEHPGGQAVLTAWRGRDCTEAVRGGVSLHTEQAEVMMRKMAIARLGVEEEEEGASWKDSMKAEQLEMKVADDM